jgi:hypothetical protein
LCTGFLTELAVISLKKLPDLVRLLPETTSKFISERMNLDGYADWRSFVTAKWPDIKTSEMKLIEVKGKMDHVLDRMIKENDTTDELLHILKSIKRFDLMEELKEEFPDDKRFVEVLSLF